MFVFHTPFIKFLFSLFHFANGHDIMTRLYMQGRILQPLFVVMCLNYEHIQIDWCFSKFTQFTSTHLEIITFLFSLVSILYGKVQGKTLRQILIYFIAGFKISTKCMYSYSSHTVIWNCGVN